MSGAQAHQHASAITRVLERLEQKCYPQELHVILDELRWRGDRSLTYENAPLLYRKCPPAISGDDLDLPENILPPPPRPA